MRSHLVTRQKEAVGGSRPGNESAVILVSGDINSATVVYEAIEQGYELSFRHTPYGRTDNKEYECSQALTGEVAAADFPHIETGNLSQIGASSLTDEKVDATDADLGSDGIPMSHVPVKNANLSSMATLYAEATDFETPFIGAHPEYFSGYPDWRPAF